MHLAVRKWRMALACGISGMSSLLIFVEFYPILLTFLKLVLGFLICFTAFFGKNLKLFFKTVFIFFVVNFLYGGFVFCLWYFVNPPTMQLKNGIVYFNISALALAIFTICAYLLISFLSYLFHKTTPASMIFSIKLVYRGREIQTQALLDTGNNLTDIFSGLPVVICQLNVIEDLLPMRLSQLLKMSTEALSDSDHDYLIENKIRILPMQAVNGMGGLYAFKPERVIVEGKSGTKACEAMIAVTSQKLSENDSFFALLGSALLS